MIGCEKEGSGSTIPPLGKEKETNWLLVSRNRSKSTENESLFFETSRLRENNFEWIARRKERIKSERKTKEWNETSSHAEEDEER